MLKKAIRGEGSGRWRGFTLVELRRHCHHQDLDRPAAARGAGGAGGGQAVAMHQQPEADRPGTPQLPRFVPGVSFGTLHQVCRRFSVSTADRPIRAHTISAAGLHSSNRSRCGETLNWLSVRRAMRRSRSSSAPPAAGSLETRVSDIVPRDARSYTFGYEYDFGHKENRRRAHGD